MAHRARRGLCASQDVVGVVPGVQATVDSRQGAVTVKILHADFIEQSDSGPNGLSRREFSGRDHRIFTTVWPSFELVFPLPQAQQEDCLSLLDQQVWEKQPDSLRRLGAGYMPTPERATLSDGWSLQIEAATETSIKKSRHLRSNLLEADHFVEGWRPSVSIVHLCPVNADSERSIGIDCTGKVSQHCFGHVHHYTARAS